MLLTLIVAHAIAFDDGSGEYAVGGNAIRLKGNSSVRMVSENIHVDLPVCRVRVSFVLKNEGPQTDVVMAFPETGGFARYYDRHDPDLKVATHFEYFRSSVDGKRVKVFRRVHDRSNGDGFYYTNWWVKNVHFKARQTRIVVDEYEGEEGSAGTGAPNTSVFSYVLGTGGTWKDSIGSGTVDIDCTHLRNYTVEASVTLDRGPDISLPVRKNKIHWTFKNYNPDKDTEIRIEWTKKGLNKYPFGR